MFLSCHCPILPTAERYWSFSSSSFFSSSSILSSLSKVTFFPKMCASSIVLKKPLKLKFNKELNYRVAYKGWNCTVLYCTVLYCTVLYCTVLYCTGLPTKDETVLYCTVLYCTLLYCNVLYRVAYKGWDCKYRILKIRRFEAWLFASSLHFIVW